MSATRLAQSIREKKVSSEEVVKACLERIADVNPKLNAVVQLCADRALVEAKEADGLPAKGKLKGPLHGVPMTIKDSFDTAGVVSTGELWDAKPSPFFLWAARCSSLQSSRTW